jgi:ADP-Ribosyltransferase in polyvalent proteins
MAVNPFDLARQLGGVIVDTDEDKPVSDPFDLARQLGGVIEDEPVVSQPVSQTPALTPPQPVTGFRGFGEGAAETFRNIIPSVAERLKQTGFGITSRAVDRLPDSIDIPPPGVPIEEIDRAGGVREYYAQVYGIRSNEELQQVKEQSQQRTAQRVEESQQRVAELTPEDLNLLQRGIRGGVESLLTMAPGVAASIATRSPIPGLAAAGAMEGFGGYAEARAEGLDPNSALAYGGINAGIEVATEAIGAAPLMKILNKSDIGGVKKELLKFAAREVPAEQAATLLQSLNSYGFGLDEELANAKTAEEAARIQAERQAVTFISTVVAGGAQAGGVAAINKVRENQIRRDIEATVRDMEGVGSDIERQRLQELRDQALQDAQTISAPEPAQINVEEGQTEPTPLQFGESYANRIFDSVGQYIPSNAEFKVEEKVVDGVTQYAVTDQENRQYGQAIQNKDQADSLALSLNNTGKARAEVLEQLQPLSQSLTSVLKGYGLNDIGLTLNNRIFTRRGEALTSEGLFDPVVRQVFLAVDAIDPQGNLDTNQRREALRGVLRHEVVHALRYLDLWKKSEWKNLETTVSRLKKQGTNKTYLEIAKEGYADQSPIIQVEEAVAELIRDVAVKQSNVAGKPRSLSERAVQFFDRAKNALTGSGFQTYEDIVSRFERGEVGARERGQIRTFRASEEQAAEKGFVPERLQRILKSPEGRNQFRADTIQNLVGSLPQQIFTAPAMNSLGNVGIREARSSIDQVPVKIKVDEQEVPTRDSEGRLIYSGYEGPEMFGVQTKPTQEGLTNFWRWFGKSKTADSSKRPLVFYHGTAADISAFRPKQAGSVFITRSPQFAEEFAFLSDNYMVSNFPDFMSDQQVVEVLDETLRSPASFAPKLYDKVSAARDQAIADVQQGKAIRPSVLKTVKDVAAEGRSSKYLNAIQTRLPSSANLMPVYVKAEKPWDYDNRDDVKAVVRRAKDNGADITPSMVEEISQGNWQTIEGSEGNAPILDAIRELGYDSMYVEEQGEKNLAVFNPEQIKSAVGNNGDFSPLTPSIRESRKEPVYNIVNSRTGEVVGQANTINGARRAVDRRDNQYGASVHTIQVVDEERNREQRAKARERLGLPALRESRAAPQQILFEVAPDPNNQPLTEAWRGLDPALRLNISNRVAQDIVPKVLAASGARGRIVSQVGSYLDDTNPSFALMLESGDPLAVAKSIGFALSQDSMMVVAPRAFKGGDVVQSVTVNLGNKTPQEVAAIYNSLREIEVDGNKPVGGQTFANGFMTILNYSDVATDTLAGLIDEKLNNEYNVLVTDVYSAFPEKKDYDYASPENDGTGKRADLRKRLRDIRAEATNSVQGEIEGIAAEGRAAAPEAAAVTPTAREARRVPRSTVNIFRMSDDAAKQELGLAPGRNLTRLVGERLNQRTLNTEGRIADDDVSDESARKIANAMVSEVEHQLGVTAETGTGIGWYSNNYPRALDILSRRFPELRTDPSARSLFTSLVAITSNGEDVNQNIANAITLYQAARQGQRISTLSIGTRRSDALQNNLEMLDSLIEQYGIDGFSDVLLQEMTVKEIKAELRRLGLSDQSDYTVDTVMPRSALYFGPKLGAFYANLMGSEGYLTMDLWWSRMFNRIRGTLIPKPTASLIQKVRGLLADQGITATTDEEVIEAAVPFWEAAKKKGYKNTTPIEKSSNTLIKSARLELEEAPFRASDRSFMIKTARLVQDSLKKKGIDLSLADIQAALWYYEKRLYAKLTGRATDDIGYEEAILKAAEADRPERSAPRFYRGRARGAVTERTGAEARQVVSAEEAVVPRAREARGPNGEVPLGPTNPGPSTNTDNTGAAEALNLGQPINSLGIPTGPQLTDTMPDGTVDISRARLEPLTRRLIRGVEFIQSAPDKLRGGVGLGDIASRIEGYYDTWAARLGQVNDIIRDANSNIDIGGKDRALNAFEQFIRLRENGRTEEAIRLRSQLSDSDRQLIDAWERIARVTGQVNLSVTTPEGDPMKVWDSKIESWRPIRAVQNFFPRTLRKEVMEVMKNPDVDPALHAELMDALIAAGRANTRQEAEDYLTRNWFSDEVKNDYFAGVEKGRTDPLPEVFYDYSWDAATRYLRKWARRTSQIEYFGQELGQFKKDWFDTNIPKIRDNETQQYLNEIKNRIYEIESFDMFNNVMSWLNSLATAAQLANPVSASLNLFGGTISNVQEFGIREIAKSYADLLLDWKRVQKEGTTLGILNTDVMNILSDHVEQDAQKYFSKEQKVSAALGKFANVMLTVGGFNGAENIVRASAMLAARSRLNRFLTDINQNPDSERVSRFKGWIAKENLNVEKLILENGAGPETEKYMRRAVNVPQGSYKIDMTPVFVDTPIGRFLFKYQKFGTQINRFFYRHFLKTFLDDPTPRNFMRAAAFVGSAVIGGQAILAVREAFGYGDPGPDDEEIKKALEKEDNARALSLILSRAWQNIIAAGSTGFFGNYVQFGLDWQDQQRVKNPMSPPGLASIDAVVDLFNRIRDQNTLTARDLDEIIETNLSAYRAYKRIGLAAMAEIGSDAREVKRFVAQRDLREIREYGRRYTEEMDIEGRTRAPTSAPIRTPMTPTNKAISDALHQGDSARARLLLREAMKGLPQKERLRIRQSVQAAIRNRQPIQVGGSAPSAKEKQAFLRWARQNLPAEKYQKIVTADRRYKSAASRMGMPIG